MPSGACIVTIFHRTVLADDLAARLLSAPMPSGSGACLFLGLTPLQSAVLRVLAKAGPDSAPFTR